MSLETGVLLTGAEPVQHGKHDVWHGVVRVASGKTVRAFVKRCPPREIVVETIATILGRSIGLPLPIPILVKVIPGRIPSVHLEADEIFFGSQSQDIPDLVQWLNKDADEDALMRRLMSWPQAASSGCFDEWIANTDRNLQNLLYDGGKNFTLIDHGKSFPSGMHAHSPIEKNLLLEVSTKRPVPHVREKVARDASIFIQSCEKMSVGELLISLGDVVDGANQHTAEIGDFLQHRLPQLGEIIATKLGDGDHGSLFGETT